MTDYERGFEAGFAAAARTAEAPRTIAAGYEPDGTGKVKRIAIGFPAELFEFVRARAVANCRSFGAEVRELIALNSHGREDQ
jgi:hypothetical protein